MLTCGALQCTADPDAAAKDLKPLPLVCDDASAAQSPVRHARSRATATRGIWPAAGRMRTAMPGDHDCDAGEHCQPVFARGKHDTLQSLRHASRA